jgi:hypothetical protein
MVVKRSTVSKFNAFVMSVAEALIRLGGLCSFGFARGTPGFPSGTADATFAPDRVGLRRFALSVQLVEHAARDFLCGAKLVDSERLAHGDLHIRASTRPHVAFGWRFGIC